MTNTIIATVLIAWVLVSALVVLSASMMSARVSRMEEEMDEREQVKQISLPKGLDSGLVSLPDFGTD